MKKVEDLKKEVSENLKSMKTLKALGRSTKSLSKKNENLNFIIRYLESNPSEEYLISERDKIQNIVSTKSGQFDYWSKNVCSQEIALDKRRNLFNKEVGITDLKRRLKLLISFYLDFSRHKWT